MNLHIVDKGFTPPGGKSSGNEPHKTKMPVNFSTCSLLNVSIFGQSRKSGKPSFLAFFWRFISFSGEISFYRKWMSCSERWKNYHEINFRQLA